MQHKFMNRQILLPNDLKLCNFEWKKATQTHEKEKSVVTDSRNFPDNMYLYIENMIS